MKDMVLPEFEGKALCSACGPAWFLDGSPTGLGKWHNKFEQEFHPIGTMETDEQGNIRPILAKRPSVGKKGGKNG